MRSEKERLKQFLQQKLQLLSEIQSELPKNAHKKAPAMPEEHEEEYMERNLEVVMTIPKEPPNPAAASEHVIRYVMVANWFVFGLLLNCEWFQPLSDERLEQEILSEQEVPQELGEVVPAAGKISRIKRIIEMDTEKLLAFSESAEDSPWEQEIRMCRLNRKLFQQDTTIREMEEAIEAFDKSLGDLFTESVEVALKANVIDLQILTLHHELIILKEFESVEEQLSQKVNQTLQELIDMEQSINEINHVLEDHKSTVAELQSKEKDIQDQFMTVVQNNKFFDFLRRIFRKRYRPPKIHTEGDGI